MRASERVSISLFNISVHRAMYVGQCMFVVMADKLRDANCKAAKFENVVSVPILTDGFTSSLLQ